MIRPPSRHGAAVRNLLRLVAVLLAAWLLHAMLSWATDQAETGRAGMQAGVLITFLMAYALLIAVPFVPGIELGLTLMVLEGPWIAPWIYLATLFGLSLAYLGGEALPYARLQRVLADLRLRSPARLIELLQPMTRAQRLEELTHRAPGWLHPALRQSRYLLIALVVNLPGNALIGGGGGILFIAGFSRLFRPLPMLLTLVIAVAPVPLVVWGLGLDVRALLR